MKSILKSIIITGLFAFSQNFVFSQDTDKTVVIIVSGSGKTQDEAKQSAFRSAIEQAFGAFISSKTEILNDKVVADQIASVANGNIQSFSILNESQLPDGSWGVTLKAMVSVSKLTSFVQAKGIAVDVKGGMFALNIKQQILNEQGEIKAVSEMVGLLHEPMQISFDYKIESGDPKSVDAESKNWVRPLTVIATANKNMDFCANYYIKTLTALSLSLEEVTSYQSLNKAVFPVEINYKGITKKIYLRKEMSIRILNTLDLQWDFYTRLFTVQSGLDERNGNDISPIYSIQDLSTKHKKEDFFTNGQQAATFSWQDERTLSQIEQITSYKVKPRGVVSQFKHGGFVVYEENGHGLVAAITDLGEMDWNSAKSACDELVLNGYSDWKLPQKDELSLLYNRLTKFGIGGFELSGGSYANWYWGAEKTYRGVSAVDFTFGNPSWFSDDDHNRTFRVRPIRDYYNEAFSEFETANKDSIQITAEYIFNRYISKIGGKKTISLINTKHLLYEAELDGITLNSELFVKNGKSKYTESIPSSNSTIERILLLDQEGYKEVKGKWITMNEFDFKNKKEEFDPQAEIHQEKYENKRIFIGENENNYILEKLTVNDFTFTKSLKGIKTIEYYNKKSGFKVIEEIKYKNNVLRKTEFNDYRDVPDLIGYKVPYSVKLEFQNLKYEMKIKEIEINKDVSDEQFKKSRL